MELIEDQMLVHTCFLIKNSKRHIERKKRAKSRVEFQCNREQKIGGINGKSSMSNGAKMLKLDTGWVKI